MDQNERQPFTARMNIDQIIGSQWIDLFESHDTLSDVWHAAPHPDPLLWMLWMSGYQNDRVLRLFAMWAAKNVVHLVPGAQSPAEVLFRTVGAYANGLASRESLDMEYSNYCNAVGAIPRRHDEFERGISAARSAIHAVIVDDAWGSVCDAMCTVEAALRAEFSEANKDDQQPLNAMLEESRQACDFASERFGEKAADALRQMVGDPFLLMDEDKGKRHLVLLRQSIKLRPLR